LPTASELGQSDRLYPAVQVEFIGRYTRPQHVFLLGRDSTGIVVRDPEANGGGVHFYPWSSIFSLTSEGHTTGPSTTHPLDSP
jgi:hypothetical protein